MLSNVLLFLTFFVLPCVSPQKARNLVGDSPIISPSHAPTHIPSTEPSHVPIQSEAPVTEPTSRPSHTPTLHPSRAPTHIPSTEPSHVPTQSEAPVTEPTSRPSHTPTLHPPTHIPSTEPSHVPTQSEALVIEPTSRPSHTPTLHPSRAPTHIPSTEPSHVPTQSEAPVIEPTSRPSHTPTLHPSRAPTHVPSLVPTTLDTITVMVFLSILCDSEDDITESMVINTVADTVEEISLENIHHYSIEFRSVTDVFSTGKLKTYRLRTEEYYSESSATLQGKVSLFLSVDLASMSYVNESANAFTDKVFIELSDSISDGSFTSRMLSYCAPLGTCDIEAQYVETQLIDKEGSMLPSQTPTYSPSASYDLDDDGKHSHRKNNQPQQASIGLIYASISLVLFLVLSCILKRRGWCDKLKSSSTKSSNVNNTGFNTNFSRLGHETDDEFEDMTNTSPFYMNDSGKKKLFRFGSSQRDQRYHRADVIELSSLRENSTTSIPLDKAKVGDEGYDIIDSSSKPKLGDVANSSDSSSYSPPEFVVL